MQIRLDIFAPIAQLHHAASKDDTRYYMQCVQFDLEAGRGRATDGHCMAEITLEGYEKGEATGCVLIPVEACKAMLKIKEKDRSSFTVTIHYGKLHLNAPGFEQSWALVDGNFPNVDEIYPKDEPVTSVGINPDLLCQVADALRGNKRQGVKITFYGDKKPVRVDMGPMGVGLVMPMRL